jgi:hypothetical protein
MDVGLELEIGFGDVEHLGGVPVRLLGKVRDLSGRSDLSAGQMPRNSGRERASLMRAKISLIARFNSLQGGKKFPVRMRRELARKALIRCPFLAIVGAPPSPNR